MEPDVVRDPEGSGSHPAGHAACSVDGASRFDPSRLDTAIALACEAHRGQVDKAGQPYILHPLRVMLRLKDEDKRIAAVLHDTVEDCGVSLGLIRIKFGDAIADAVDALSRRDGETYADFIERCGMNDIARAVKLEDLEDNMNTSRLPFVTDADLRRNMKYARAGDRLNAIAIEAATAGETA